MATGFRSPLATSCKHNSRHPSESSRTMPRLAFSSVGKKDDGRRSESLSLVDQLEGKGSYEVNTTAFLLLVLSSFDSGVQGQHIVHRKSRKVWSCIPLFMFGIKKTPKALYHCWRRRWGSSTACPSAPEIHRTFPDLPPWPLSCLHAGARRPSLPKGG